MSAQELKMDVQKHGSASYDVFKQTKYQPEI